MITVYSKQNCMQCMFTKKFLDENNIEYKSIDVTQDDEALALIKEHKHQGVPVVSINNFADSWSGFQPDRLEELKEVANLYKGYIDLVEVAKMLEEEVYIKI